LNRKPRILISPLNWGLGHATRCIPIIDTLIELGAEVFLASDGRALALLEKEYPDLVAFPLPGYNVRYEGTGMIWNVAKQLPKISRAILAERKAINKIVKKEKIEIIISDNRYGCRNKQTKNIFITHQINIAIPNRRLEIITNKINYHFINLFDECWIPDFEGTQSLAGKLSETKADHLYIGPLSRFEFKESKKEYDLIAVLSGPEPQRSILEEKIIGQLKNLDIKTLIVQGKTEKKEEVDITKNIRMVSFLTSRDLNAAILKSDIVLARSGYSTIMDLAALRKKAILIPTPGQTEQEYLAERLSAKQLFYHQKQEDFDLKSALKESEKFLGFEALNLKQNLLQKALHALCNIQS
jgi:uncharacterized protein (TIGR00661 family)